MGGKPAKLEKKEKLGLKIVPPVDRAYARWLARDLERIYGFTPRNPCAIKPPDHYIEYMRFAHLISEYFLGYFVMQLCKYDSVLVNRWILDEAIQGTYNFEFISS
ncbi:UNVERIFIED_CONTAM: hypothetical protein Sradi_1169300 [Sesamum radiatum]|uniref:Uncharacterized protein n=1 Tax=Sesamum radiatum TaxID=300843 RepID=A0AAW2ULQ2_SESRA